MLVINKFVIYKQLMRLLLIKNNNIKKVKIMKKTERISLGGSVFTVEEDAYNYLLEYQKALQNQYRTQTGGREIIHDIEVRMAELFNYKLDKVKQVITYLDVFEVIEVLGKPESFDETHINSSQVEADEFEVINRTRTNYNRNSRSEKRWNKRAKSIFRDIDNRVLGGVCAGLGAYFGISPVVFRVLFVLLFFIGGGSLIIYGILWVALPAAYSVTQKMEMRGESIDISNIENKVREELEKLKNAFKNF